MYKFDNYSNLLLCNQGNSFFEKINKNKMSLNNIQVKSRCFLSAITACGVCVCARVKKFMKRNPKLTSSDFYMVMYNEVAGLL